MTTNGSTTGGGLGVGAHCDSGFLTLLYQARCAAVLHLGAMLEHQLCEFPVKH